MTDDQREGYQHHQADSRKSMLCKCGSYCVPGHDTCREDTCERDAAIDADVKNAHSSLSDVVSGDSTQHDLLNMTAAKDYLSAAIELKKQGE